MCVLHYIYMYVYYQEQRLMDEYKEIQKNVQQMRAQKTNLTEKIYKHKKESLERLTKLKQLVTEDGKLTL